MISLLQRLIQIPSISRDESACADELILFMTSHGLQPHRHANNIWCVGQTFLPHRPTLLLNAHIDTVKPVSGWQRDPFTATLENDRLYGLGANDCGGGLVALLFAFMHLQKEDDGSLPYNLIYLASAEEEVSGKNGIESVLPLLPKIDVAIVGEPTGMQPAIAEKGLMVLDCTAHGVSGHAAREEGVNAIYKAMVDIEWLRTHRFEKVSPLLGAVKTSVTQIQAGTQHNVVPDCCTFVVDVRTNECYSNAEVLEEIKQNLNADVVARSTRLNSSHIDIQHPLIQYCISQGKHPFGSPTLSDQALMPFPSFKLGPGHSARSHTADEYICLSELEDALNFYISLIKG
ncbi:MAG: M20 family metallo-hydrolase [Bacteroidaceae bacterium]|nr:M20 family metallo-hydrolase [Bacteroidaceae bacterium]